MLELGVAADSAMLLKKLIETTDTSRLKAKPSAERDAVLDDVRIDGGWTEQPAYAEGRADPIERPLTCMVDTNDEGHPCTDKTFKARSSLKAHFKTYHKTNGPAWPAGRRLPAGYEHMQETRVGKIAVCR